MEGCDELNLLPSTRQQQFNESYFFFNYIICIKNLFSVFEIMLKISEGLTWQETLIRVLPVRKGAHICNASNSNLSLDSENAVNSI